jgi:hypothetical protein
LPPTALLKAAVRGALLKLKLRVSFPLAGVKLIVARTGPVGPGWVAPSQSAVSENRVKTCGTEAVLFSEPEPAANVREVNPVAAVSLVRSKVR